jgi:hypothetical protein
MIRLPIMTRSCGFWIGDWGLGIVDTLHGHRLRFLFIDNPPTPQPQIMTVQSIVQQQSNCSMTRGSLAVEYS